MQKTVGGVGLNYLFDLAGREVTRLNAAGIWVSGEVYVGKQHLATYGDSTTTFDHADWLGTERARTNVSAGLCESMISLPFGDGFSTSGSCSDMSPLHFTGKEHDYESNLENFGARYYNSVYGRFVTPDWAGKPEAVPYSDLSNPQSLNQYVLVRDDPTTFADLDGHLITLAQSMGWGGDNCAGSSVYTCSGQASNVGVAESLDLGMETQHQQDIQNQTATITYDAQAPPMRPKTQDYIELVIEAAGLDSINISATTNGEHAPNSNHYDGSAVDINKVNGERVIDNGSNPSVAADVRSLQKAANDPKVGVAHENFGPAGLYKDGKQIINKKLQAQHENHVHITIPRNTNDDN